jgi:hypothetical protein
MYIKMGKPGSLPESVISSPDAAEDERPKEEGIDKPPKKPGSKAQGRKRTKTGCLSEFTTHPGSPISVQSRGLL